MFIHMQIRNLITFMISPGALELELERSLTVLIPDVTAKAKRQTKWLEDEEKEEKRIIQQPDL